MFYFQGKGNLLGERFQKLQLLGCQGSPHILWAQGYNAKTGMRGLQRYTQDIDLR